MPSLRVTIKHTTGDDLRAKANDLAGKYFGPDYDKTRKWTLGIAEPVEWLSSLCEAEVPTLFESEVTISQ